MYSGFYVTFILSLSNKKCDDEFKCGLSFPSSSPRGKNHMCSEVIFPGLFMFNMCTLLQGFTVQKKHTLLFIWKSLGGDIIYTFLSYLRIVIVNRQLSVEKKNKNKTLALFFF